MKTGISHLEFRASAILRDGSPVLIRALQRDDKERILELFAGLSRRSIYFRFFRSKEWLSEGELVQLTDLDFVREAALAAVVHSGGREHILGICRYAEKGNDPRSAEVAFAVAEQYQGRGVGTLLLEHLIPIARANGIIEFEADVLKENERMMRLFSDLGLEVACSCESGVFHICFPIEETEKFRMARAGRRMTAERQRRFAHDSGAEGI